MAVITENDLANFDVLALRIKNVREHFGLSKREFANKVKLSPAFISKLEEGSASYRMSDLKQICEMCHLDLAYLTKYMRTENIDQAFQEQVFSYAGVEVGWRLRRERIEKNWRQSELAEASGMSQGLISGIETGKKTMTEKQARKLADVLGVGAEYLLTGDENKKDYPVNDQLIAWLWQHIEVRKVLWDKINAAE